MSTYPNVRLLLLFVLLCTATQFTNAQTFFGRASSVGDGGSAAGTTASITPPNLMQAGDLVIVYAHYRGTTGTLSVSNQGGQAWNTGVTTSASNQSYFIAWCRFNGTWSANPVVTGSGSGLIALTAVMYVYRPTNANNTWGVQLAQTNSSGVGTTQALTGFTTTLPNTVTMAFWGVGAANTWGTLGGGGWSKTGLLAQNRNTVVSGQSHTAAYRLMTGTGNINNVQQVQSANVATLKAMMSWHEYGASTVTTGKSFINITRPNGGTVIPGDELEIRVSVNVSVNGTRIFRTRYNDTIPTNLNYVPGSLRILTNESKVYKSFTDAAGDDAGFYNAGTRTVRFNLGRDTTGNPVGNLSSTGIDSSLGGGYFNPQTHRPVGNGVLMIVTYRVIVDASVPYNTIFNYGGGAIRYRNQLTVPGTIDYVLNPNPLNFIVYPNFGLCDNATGLNYITAGLGDFGSGVAHNGPDPGTVLGYLFAPVTNGAPGDGQYGVTKNLSPSQVTNPFVVRPQDPSVDRIFGVWDIIGDHTGAVNQLAGNPPSANGANGGYMLAVNAAYQLSVANEQVITGLCEDTYYEFSAWFRNVCRRCGSDSAGRGASGLDVNVPVGYIPTAPGDSSGVRPNLTFQIDGVDYYNSGDINYIGQWGEWVQKGFVFRTAPGQTSMTISIKNNAPGGGGNDWVMDDISLVTCLPSLEMRPSNNPAYCLNGQVDVSVAVSTFYDNYAYYQWERSTDNGVTWGPAPELPAIQTYSYTSSGGNFLDTVALPSFLASATMNGYQYRIRTSTSLTNITSDACAIYNSTDLIEITVNPSCDVLPAQLLQFNVQAKDGKASLLWKVKQEGNLSRYLVERSTDGRIFKSIGSVAARGASVLEEQYLFTDPVLITGKVYYRLKLETNEGISKYSNILSVSSAQQQQFAINNLVNPFAGKISFQLETFLNGPVEVQLLDASGRPIMQKKIFANKGANAVSVDVPAYLQKGSYLLRVVSEAGIVNRVIQKQ